MTDMGDFQSWDPESQARAAALLKDRTENPPKVWYCVNPGRACDGRPHQGYPYPHARSDQWPPVGDDWFVWLLMSGRGAGKTRSGAEYVRKMSEHVPRIAGIGRRITDIRETIVEGQSGLIAACENAKVAYDWKPALRRFTFANGAVMHFYSGEEPDSLRGPQFGLAWIDEPAHMPLIEDVWDMMMLGLRLGERPRVLATTTPIPSKWMKKIASDSETRVVRVSTYANLDNLAPTFRKEVLSRYEGTRLGRQELHGEIIPDIEGALWTSEMVEAARDEELDPKKMIFDRIVVGVDPAGSSGRRSDETGIVVCARSGSRQDGTYYVLDDLSGKYTPNQWASKVAWAFKKWNAHRVIAEKNFGGEMVESTLLNAQHNLPLDKTHSQPSKELRAEPIVALYEQNRVAHLGKFEELEVQMCEWVPDRRSSSPDRIDAMVFAMAHLAGGGGPASIEIPEGDFHKGPVVV